MSLVLIVSAAAAMSLKNLIHCALCLAVCFMTLGFMFMYQGAEFIGLVQILVYVGAVAVLILFAILLVKGSKFGEMQTFTTSWKWGISIAFCLFLTIVICILTSSKLQSAPIEKKIQINTIGKELMTVYVLPLEVIGLLLTTALIGGVFLAAKKDKNFMKLTDHNGGR